MAIKIPPKHKRLAFPCCVISFLLFWTLEQAIPGIHAKTGGKVLGVLKTWPGHQSD